MAKKALVVDNDFFFVEFLTELLESKGYEVVKAYDGKEGVSKLEESVFDVLFADLIMPKIDGIQLIRFARKKIPPGQLNIVAVSGTLIEQIEEIKNIGADYCVVKGPLEEMTDYLGGLLDNLAQNKSAPRFVDPGKLYPRQATAELVDELSFQKAVFDSIGVGILVVDRDARLMRANTMALELLHKKFEDVVNLRITDVFPQEGRGRLVKALKEVTKDLQLKRRSFYLSISLKIVVSVLRMGKDPDGWILTMEDIGS
ncbi:response regulator receiver domain protein [delta proteobacterium NaphS2]|nr:response regulator receiver domain protein [delta proteobacterium NaphS2]